MLARRPDDSAVAEPKHVSLEVKTMALEAIVSLLLLKQYAWQLNSHSPCLCLTLSPSLCIYLSLSLSVPLSVFCLLVLFFSCRHCLQHCAGGGGEHLSGSALQGDGGGGMGEL